MPNRAVVSAAAVVYAFGFDAGRDPRPAKG